MGIKLLDLKVGEILEKFGSGNHKPGSGSAAAYEALQSAKLILTVISLTKEPKRYFRYREWLPSMLRMEKSINERIFPELAELFQVDSDEFDKTIKLREARDKESDPHKKRILSNKASAQLKVSTELPIKIAKLSLELADYGVYLLDHGFRSARGDSSVAMHSALSATAGCLSIIELNLLSFQVNQWEENIRIQLKKLRARYEDTVRRANDSASVLRKEEEENRNYHLVRHNYKTRALPDTSKLTNTDIENIAREVQNDLWKHRERAFKEEIPTNQLDVLKPEVALKQLLGYKFIIDDDLGIFESRGDVYTVAGLINKDSRQVRISKKFNYYIQNFTAAHELGHALLHDKAILHRDMPNDGSFAKGTKNKEEHQADKFAAYFLMPTRQVIKAFAERFQTDVFRINHDTAFMLTGRQISDLRKAAKNSKAGLARVLVNTERYGGRSFMSLADHFNVSEGAMAIRLEELGLVEF